jgi:putative N6-adenine-specific DNA methylase
MLTQNALRRRLKRRLLKEVHTFFASCSPGFEEVLETEVRAIAPDNSVAVLAGGVEFTGPLDLIYTANMKLNTANRVLLRIKTFPARTFPMLYDQIGRIDWELYISEGVRFDVFVRSHKSALNMSKRIADTVISSIHARLSSFYSTEVQATDPMELLVRLDHDFCTISFNTSGRHLHKRGYKLDTVDAPLRETVASSVLLQLDHSKHDLIVDPFCGSGTYLLESARMARGVPPGAFRSFSFESTPFFQKSKLEKVKCRAEHHNGIATYIGFDVSKSAIEAARRNAARANLDDLVRFDSADFRDVDFQSLGGTFRRPLLISNPPYGRRVKISRGSSLSSHELKSKLSGWKVAVLTVDREQVAGGLIRNLGNPQTTLVFRNGGLKTYLNVFVLE